ncbi:hypothetical protein NIES970_17520 [[Synechococcus] sp. NIES-970]|nr:hypothetical protein NIES970_17520 [[Synechococcus] sp. NIES-970]
MNQERLTLKKNLGVLSVVATTSAIFILGANQAFAGQFNVVTTGGSTPTGAVNFPTEKDRVSIKIAGIQTMAVSQAIALNEGTITQAQADTGLGSGGAVIDLSSNPQAVAAIITAANEREAATSLTTNADALDMAITMPNGTSVILGQILRNLSAALASGDPIALPTALNDGAVAMRLALQAELASSNGAAPEVQAAAEAIAELLKVARG